MDGKPRSTVVALTPSESWALLLDAIVGRVALVVDNRPEVLPVNYLVDHGGLVFRTGEGSKLAAAIGGSVAFEVDDYDPMLNGDAWSVVVKGTAWDVTPRQEALDAPELPEFQWHAASKPRVVRIEPEEISGRRFHLSHAREEACPQVRGALPRLPPTWSGAGG
jgi:uncharacterized protein